jgi:hypothetical protein
MKDIKDEKQAREKARIYKPYIIDFVTKLGKTVYHADAFIRVNNFDLKRICRTLFNKVKRIVNSETYEVI